MRDYAKRGLLSPLSPAFRGTTGVNGVGAIYKSAAAYAQSVYWDLPRSHGIKRGEKIVI